MKVAQEMKLPAETVQRAWTRFLATAEALGKPWGDDEIGSQWSSIYDPALAKFDENMKIVVKSLLQLSDALNAMGHLYTSAENANLS